MFVSRPVTDAERSAVASMAKAGFGARRMARCLKRGTQTVQKILAELDREQIQRAEVYVPPHRRRPPPRQRPPTFELLVNQIPAPIMQLLESAALRRSMKVPDLALTLLGGVLVAGSIDKTRGNYHDYLQRRKALGETAEHGRYF